MIPKSHINPHDHPATGWSDAELNAPHAADGAVHVTGRAGSVCVMDCRIWVRRRYFIELTLTCTVSLTRKASPFQHCTPPNCTRENRVMINIRYAPRWLYPLQ